MDTIYLPYVSSNDTIQFAMERMRQTDSRALVVEHDGDGPYLYFNTQVAQAWRRKVVQCGELMDFERQRVAYIDGEIKDSAADYLWEWFEEKLDQEETLYGMVFPPKIGLRGMALVITRHEGLRYDIEGRPKECTCTGPKMHPATDPPKSSGQQCGQCGYVYDCI